MMTQTAAPAGPPAATAGVGRGNRLIPEPRGVTDNPREEP